MFKSIMKAKAVVARGMVWQVGDGSKINFWNDPWVYFLGVYKPLRHWVEAQDIPIVTVQDALLVGGYWNEPLLGSLPMPIRSAITSTIIRANIPNKLVWQFTKKGNFSAKSAYHVAPPLKTISPQASTSSFNPKLYLQIWQVKIPYKVQNLIWKASHNILPTYVTDEQMENDSTSTPPESSWINPPLGWVKLNFDASFHKDCYYTNIVVIGRDSRGEFLGGKVSRVKATSPGEAEALAVELAVNYAVQQHWREVIVEGDAKSVILAYAYMISASSWTWNQALCNISMRSSSFNTMLFRFTP
ncbi:hypothetical protein IFM89_033810 [Coptis chinensis]|uniref:RNase H type-1 domain-containing protein n=1 Tax=Coptis chinensis TaxID=261450 RepID=A0A835LPX6_9MAGN|nr:hypothetical protein IFM89_033810 [Coptis chinensis]